MSMSILSYVIINICSIFWFCNENGLQYNGDITDF